jgi:hypothetical protein
MKTFNIKALIVILATGMVFACLKQPATDENFVVFTLKTEAPEKLPDLDMEVLNVQMIGNLGKVYKGTMDETGTITFAVVPGRYRIMITGRVETEDGRANITAGLEDFMLTPNGILEEGGIYRSAEKRVDLAVGFSSPLIIREIYYGGCASVAGGTYQRDQYIEVYNNSAAVQYLDSLIVGAMAPANSGAASGNLWAGKDVIATFSYQFMVPGNGRTHPLQPGESAVFVLNAADHSQLGATSGLRLDKAHFVLYHPEFTMQAVPDPSVVVMDRIGLSQGTAYALSVSSPAVVIYRIPNMREYQANSSEWQKYQPGAVSGILYWHIHKDWILDGVECITNPAAAFVNKRLPSSVDVSYTWLVNGQYKGTAVTRKVEDVLPDGRVVYQDTNNSAEDFENVPAKPRLRP